MNCELVVVSVGAGGTGLSICRIDGSLCRSGRDWSEYL